jgi:hypothetical protein
MDIIAMISNDIDSNIVKSNIGERCVKGSNPEVANKIADINEQ